MDKVRSKVALVFVAGALVASMGALGAEAKPGKGKHGPCEHGRHKGNKHCKVASPVPSSSASSTEAPTPVPSATATS
ncbi:MAG TPA: hypothetical protein VIG64_11730 [Actinomycetota bacterium]|jgi:hypothetical protein